MTLFAVFLSFGSRIKSPDGHDSKKGGTYAPAALLRRVAQFNIRYKQLIIVGFAGPATIWSVRNNRSQGILRKSCRNQETGGGIFLAAYENCLKEIKAKPVVKILHYPVAGWVVNINC